MKDCERPSVRVTAVFSNSVGNSAYRDSRNQMKASSMSTTRKIAVFVGSLRKGSYNRMTAKVLAALAPAGL